MLCAAVLSGLGWLAGQAPGFGLLPALILLPLVAWPCWLGLAYRAAVRRVLARAVLREDRSPWWAPLLGGALWRQILAVPVALLAAWTVAWTLIVGGWQGWAGIAVTAMLLWPVAWLIRSQMGALRPHARLRAVLAVAPVAVAGVMTMAGLAMTALPAPGRLADQVATQGRYEGPSALLAWATDATALLQGARLWGLGLVAEQAWPVAMLWQGA